MPFRKDSPRTRFRRSWISALILPNEGYYAQHFGARGGLDIMALILTPLHPVFVAEATGLDLTKPISRADACEINAAMNEYGVLVWRGQPLTAQQQIQFATAFGPLDIGLKRVFKRPERQEGERLIDNS